MVEREILINKIKEIIKNNEFLLREDNKEIWENIYQNSPKATIRYKQNFIDYQNCYFREYYESESGFYEDCSFIVTRGKIPVGLVPLYIAYKDSNYVIGSNGEVGIYSPLIKEGYGSIETHRSMYDTIIRMYDEIAKLSDSVPPEVNIKSQPAGNKVKIFFLISSIFFFTLREGVYNAEGL